MKTHHSTRFSRRICLLDWSVLSANEIEVIKQDGVRLIEKQEQVSTFPSLLFPLLFSSLPHSLKTRYTSLSLRCSPGHNSFFQFFFDKITKLERTKESGRKKRIKTREQKYEEIKRTDFAKCKINSTGKFF